MASEILDGFAEAESLKPDAAFLLFPALQLLIK
jgi:hypothetical protein